MIKKYKFFEKFFFSHSTKNQKNVKSSTNLHCFLFSNSVDNFNIQKNSNFIQNIAFCVTDFRFWNFKNNFSMSQFHIESRIKNRKKRIEKKNRKKSFEKKTNRLRRKTKRRTQNNTVNKSLYYSQWFFYIFDVKIRMQTNTIVNIFCIHENFLILLLNFRFSKA